MKKYLALLLLMSPLIAEESPCFNSCECCDGPCAARVTARHTDPGGIGYRRGYTSVDLFATNATSAGYYSFFDFRGHLFNNGTWGTNIGIGTRTLSSCWDVVYGANFYWDWREAEHTTFHQLGAGIEVLWPCWDFHANGYVPVNRHKHSYREGFERFQSNQAIFFKKYELALPGFDLSLGYRLFDCNWFRVHTALGGYYFQGDYGEFAAGGLLRARVDVCDWIRLGGQVSYDNQFKWQGGGQVGVSYTFGPSIRRYPRQTRCCADIIALEERLVEQPQRFEIIVTTTHKKKGRARNPNTGELLTIFFVDNTSSSNGTFESPFSTLATAEAAAGPGNAIYVFPGNGTDSGMNAGIILQNNQLLGGSGGPFEVLTRFGVLEVPTQTNTMPIISNTGDTVTLANGNYISGLEIRASGGAGSNAIFGIDTQGLQVAFSTLTNPIGEGIDIDGMSSGTFTFKNNIIQVFEDGVELDDHTGNLFIENNLIFVVNNDAIGLNAFNGQAFIRNNLISSADNDAFESLDFTGKLFVQGNTILANPGSTTEAGDDGIDLVVFSGEFIAHNNLLIVAGEGFQLGSYSGNLILKGNRVEAIRSGFEALLVGTTEAQFVSNTFVSKNNNSGGGTQTIRIENMGDYDAIFFKNSFVNDNLGFLNKAYHFDNLSGTSLFRVEENIISSPADTADASFINSNGVLLMESPTLNIEGVERLNGDARIDTTGDITFIPLSKTVDIPK